MKTENGREYRIDKLKGFTYFKNGVITDLDNRVFAINAGGSIGMINTSHTEPVAALYVLSDKDGLLYIGTDMPDNYEKYLPCEYITFGDNGAQTVKFCFGYLQDYIGPYLIPTDITVNDNSPFSVINIPLLRLSFTDCRNSKYPKRRKGICL